MELVSEERQQVVPRAVRPLAGDANLLSDLVGRAMFARPQTESGQRHLAVFFVSWSDLESLSEV